MYTAGLDIDLKLHGANGNYSMVMPPYVIKETYNGRENKRRTWINPEGRFAELAEDADPMLLYALGGIQLPEIDYTMAVPLCITNGTLPYDVRLNTLRNSASSTGAGEPIERLRSYNWNAAEMLDVYISIDKLKDMGTSPINEVYHRLNVYRMSWVPDQSNVIGLDAAKELFRAFAIGHVGDEPPLSVNQTYVHILADMLPIQHNMFDDFINSIDVSMYPPYTVAVNIAPGSLNRRYSENRNLTVELVQVDDSASCGITVEDAIR